MAGSIALENRDDMIAGMAEYTTKKRIESQPLTGTMVPYSFDKAKRNWAREYLSELAIELVARGGGARELVAYLREEYENYRSKGIKPHELYDPENTLLSHSGAEKAMSRAKWQISKEIVTDRRRQYADHHKRLSRLYWQTYNAGDYALSRQIAQDIRNLEAIHDPSSLEKTETDTKAVRAIDRAIRGIAKFVEEARSAQSAGAAPLQAS